MSQDTDPPRGKKGGEARAAKLSKPQLSEASSKAAITRWDAVKGIAKSEYQGTIELGTATVPCAVVETPSGEVIRVISSAQFMKALGRPWKGTYERTGRPNFLEANNLQPFITKELEDVLELVEYRTDSGLLAKGYRAEMVPLVCETYLSARDIPGALHPSQAGVAKACEIIMRSLARVGIVALVDEATGYQAVRAVDALSKILKQYVLDEVRKWTETFPEKFYRELFRLRGWAWTERSISGKRPGVVGKYTDDIVYDRLAPGVLDELRKKNPTVSAGRRKQRHHQWLTGDVGHPKLLAHLEGVWLLMRQSKTWNELKDKLDEYYPIHELTENGLQVHVKRRKIGSKS